MEMGRKHQEEINWLRGFAAFLVVLGHAIIVFPIDLHEIPWCKYLYDTIYSFHMPLFFAISGYCYSMRDYSSYLKKKAKRLLIPYFVFTFGGLLPRIALPGLVNGNEPMIGASILKIFLEGREYWFLYTLFIIFAVFPLVAKALQANKRITLIVIFGIGILSKLAPRYLCLPKVMYYIVPFTIGYIARKQSFFRLKDELAKYSKGKKSFLAALLCLAILICGYLHGKYDLVVLNQMEAFIGTGACFVMTCLIPSALKRFGKYSAYSLPLYLLNGYFLVVSRTLAVNILKLDNPVMIIAINMALDFYISYLLIRYVLSRIPVVRDILGIA